MAKPQVPQKPLSPTTPQAPKSADRLSWPSSPKELQKEPRSYRIHRLDAFTWQAFVIEDGVEFPIGKPDLFDILRGKVSGVMRAEGQIEFLEKKTRDEIQARAAQAKPHVK